MSNFLISSSFLGFSFFVLEIGSVKPFPLIKIVTNEDYQEFLEYPITVTKIWKPHLPAVEPNGLKIHTLRYKHPLIRFGIVNADDVRIQDWLPNVQWKLSVSRVPRTTLL